MSQSFPGTIDPASTSGTALATLLTSWAAAENTLNSGNTQPSYRAAGTLWLDTTTAANTILKVYDGTVWINIGFINATSHITARPLTTAYNNADQSVSNATQTLLACNTEQADIGSQFASNTFTCVYPGTYIVSAQIQWTCTGGVFSTTLGSFVTVTNAAGTQIFASGAMGTGSTTHFAHGTRCINLAVGDTVRIGSIASYSAGTAVANANSGILNIALIA